MFYAGIGSRQTPAEVLSWMTAFAVFARSRGLVLRSGGAPGADTAFEAGAEGNAQIFLPWKGFEGRRSPLWPPTPEALHLASQVHPRWHRCSRAIQALHGRNAHQVLGGNLASPVRFVVCWTRDGAQTAHDCTRETGGTATAIRIASRYSIPVFNLARPGTYATLNDFMG